MEEGLKKFCTYCEQKKDIVEIEREFKHERIKLSCGHEIGHRISKEKARTLMDVKLIKYFPQFSRLIKSEQRKTIVNINREENKISLIVKQKNEKGEMEIVNSEEKSFY